ncbi:hypothetical protein O1611_g1742 [Lasiodiplodia mahajangana]|uniref:Uncharacterized protein n=1 Tax=Lasiodiplodia mahajangana TaxID=1108764 RepID=A0ACC2JX29_9PEZI|nr:hypothetical protein O1611_g1742 [Lasiodiplodia mahajangana]
MGDRLASMSEAKAKTILLALCSEDSALEQRALRFLSDIDALEGSKVGTKRKASSTIKICVQCQDAFYEEENNDKACRYHDGELDPDYESDVWADHDENCHGVIDCDENREEYPEGFVWSCCGKLGYRGGCTRGRHSADSGQRGKYGDAPGTVVETEESSFEESNDDDEDSDKDSDDDDDDDNERDQ